MGSIRSELRLLMIIIFYALTGLLSLPMAEETAPNKGTLTISIRNIRKLRGSIDMTLYDMNRKKPFAYIHKKVPVAGPIINIKLNNVPYGEYAVILFHDRNGNSRIDYRVFPLPGPIEGIGVSNNVSGLFGPPRLKDAAFRFNRDDLSLNIYMDY
ncbi:MAG: DUF2141 domain-containing protein [Elusimicrobia bacterium]|nr:DUF2141 domain-containing protein [Elusimicrobiota bacterium]